MNERNPLITVIVPIYNVKPYLRKCSDSLMAQTLKQIEVLMIDDGSTDGSGGIAEEYLTQNGEWPEFRLIKFEKNRGLSAARNTGIMESRADWIMFVDSDDWVEPEFCRMPYEAAIENKTDMAIFQADEIVNGRTKKDKSLVTAAGIIDEFMAHEHGRIIAWNKIYKRSLFDSIKYPEGRVSEDIATTHKLVHKAKTIVMISNVLYHHVKRKDSISYTNTPLYNENHFLSVVERYEDLISYGVEMDRVYGSLISAAIRYLSRTNPCEDETYLKAKRIADSNKTIPRTINKKQRFALLVWKVNVNLFYCLSKISGRVKQNI